MDDKNSLIYHGSNMFNFFLKFGKTNSIESIFWATDDQYYASRRAFELAEIHHTYPLLFKFDKNNPKLKVRKIGKTDMQGVFYEVKSTIKLNDLILKNIDCDDASGDNFKQIKLLSDVLDAELVQNGDNYSFVRADDFKYDKSLASRLLNYSNKGGLRTSNSKIPTYIKGVGYTRQGD